MVGPYSECTPDPGGHIVQGKDKERWVELCEQAAVEQDSKKLIKLIQEIDRLLREKQERLDKARSNN
jgi:hypothetical protein